MIMSHGQREPIFFCARIDTHFSAAARDAKEWINLRLWQLNYWYYDYISRNVKSNSHIFEFVEEILKHNYSKQNTWVYLFLAVLQNEILDFFFSFLQSERNVAALASEKKV